jgi:hypothetical protein
MSSDYIIWNEKDITIKKLVLRNITHQEIFENVSVANLHVAGPYNTTLITQAAIIYSLGSELPILNVSSLNHLRIYVEDPAINFTIKQNGEEKSLTISKSYVEFEFSKGITTNLRLQKPLIMLNPGSLNTSWEGVFWCNGKMFTTVARAEYWVINGLLSLEIAHSDRVMVIKLSYKENISVTTDDK